MMCRVLAIYESEAHQFNDMPRAHAATNQHGMQSHTLTVQCKHRETAQLLNTLSKHMVQ